MPMDVDDQSAAVQAMARNWPMIDALVGGTGAMREAGRKFLPQFPGEPDDAYAARLATATLFPAFSRTCQVLSAKPLSKAITVDDVQPDVEALFDNIDGQGATLHAFAGSLMLACLQYGLQGVLADFPPVPPARTKADEQAVGARPYLCIYAAQSILGWRLDRNRLVQLRLMEEVTEEDGPFGEKLIKQVRVLTPGTWQVWRQVKSQTGRDEWAVFNEGKTTLPEIPFVFFYGIRESFGVGAPPLLDLAYLNVEHWQSSSDQQNILHTARVPILFVKGLEDDAELTIGANTAIRTTSDKADVKFVEHSGQAIAAGRQSLLDLEDRMRQTGAELLVQQPMQTTATQTVAEGEGSKSILQRIVETFEESLEGCISLLGDWIGQPCQPEVTLFKDFGATNLSDQSATTVLTASDKGLVSKETAFGELQRRDIVSPDVNWEDEKARLAAEEKAKPPKPELMQLPPRPINGDPAESGEDDLIVDSE